MLKPALEKRLKNITKNRFHTITQAHNSILLECGVYILPTRKMKVLL